MWSLGSSRRFRHAFRNLIAGAAALLTGVCLLPTASAQKKGSPEELRISARDEYRAGTEAFKKQDYDGALKHFEKANDYIQSPQAQYWIAQSLEKLGRPKEAAIAYETLLAQKDVDKIGAEKLSTAKERLAALQAQETAPAEPMEPTTSDPLSEPPPPEPAPEPPPPTEEPAPELIAAPPEPPRDTAGERYKPQNNSWELGVFGGPLFISRAHNLHKENRDRRLYELPAWLAGARAAYFPSRFVGIEAEFAHGWGSVDSDGSAQFNTVRGHVIGQVGIWRFVPFVLAGAGLLHATSDSQGPDRDVLVEVGAGAKVAVTQIFSPRLDLRLDMTQREGGGVAFSEEILLGASLTFGR